MKRTRYFSKGQSLVEWALILPMLIFILIAVVDLGRVVYYYSVVSNAAREAARYGIIYPTDATGMRTAAKQMAVGIDLTDGNIVPWYDAYNDKVQVRITYEFLPITPLIGDLFAGGTIPIEIWTTMRVEK